MGPHAASTDSATGEQFTISAGGSEATVASLAGALRTYRRGGTDLVEPFGADELPPLGSGILLAPWGNRIRDGRWMLDGEAQVFVDDARSGARLPGLNHDQPAVHLAALDPLVDQQLGVLEHRRGQEGRVADRPWAAHGPEEVREIGDHAAVLILEGKVGDVGYVVNNHLYDLSIYTEKVVGPWATAAALMEKQGLYIPHPSNLCNACGVRAFCKVMGGERAGEAPDF